MKLALAAVLFAVAATCEASWWERVEAWAEEARGQAMQAVYSLWRSPSVADTASAVQSLFSYANPPRVFPLTYTNWTLLHSTSDTSADTTDNTMRTSAADKSNATAWIVMVYAEWCPHSKALQPLWDELSQATQQRRIPITVATIDAVAYPGLVAMLDVKGYPSIRYVANNTVRAYRKGRSLHQLIAFIEEKPWLNASLASAMSPFAFKLPSVDEGWSAWTQIQIELYHHIVHAVLFLPTLTPADFLKEWIVFPDEGTCQFKFINNIMEHDWVRRYVPSRNACLEVLALALIFIVSFTLLTAALVSCCASSRKPLSSAIVVPIDDEKKQR